jgi:hypothetical protein
MTPEIIAMNAMKGTMRKKRKHKKSPRHVKRSGVGNSSDYMRVLTSPNYLQSETGNIMAELRILLTCQTGLSNAVLSRFVANVLEQKRRLCLANGKAIGQRKTCRNLLNHRR